MTVPADDGDARDRAEHWYATGVYGHVTLPQAVLAASSARPDLPIVFDSATRRAALTLEYSRSSIHCRGQPPEKRARPNSGNACAHPRTRRPATSAREARSECGCHAETPM